MSGYVYAIECGDAVKIGYANDPVRRLSELNVAHPGHHRLIGFVQGTLEDESRLHGLCASAWIKGEWFRKEGAVLHFLDLVPKYSRPTKVRRQSAPSNLGLSERLKQLFPVVSDTAKSLGVKPATIRKWRSRGVPPVWQIRLVQAACGMLSFSDFVPRQSPREGEAA